ncbi:hypothetical protein MTO96_028760 [Rhipicephalus appendiculatus]
MPIEVLIVAVVPLLTIGTWFTYAPNYIPVLAQSLLERIGFGAQGVRAGIAGGEIPSTLQAVHRQGKHLRGTAALEETWHT